MKQIKAYKIILILIASIYIFSIVDINENINISRSDINIHTKTFITSNSKDMSIIFNEVSSKKLFFFNSSTNIFFTLWNYSNLITLFLFLLVIKEVIINKRKKIKELISIYANGSKYKEFISLS